MRHTILHAPLCAILLLSDVRGDALANVTDAQRAVATAESSMTGQAGELQRIAKELADQADTLGNLGRELDSQLDAARKLGPLVDRAVVQANADVNAARGAFGERERALRDAEAAILERRRELEIRHIAANQAAGDERQAFARSPEVAAANGKIAAATAEVERLTKELDEQVKLDVKASRLAAETAEAEKKVVAERAAQPTNAERLAEASAAWIAAKNRSEAARREVFARHAPYARAVETLGEARRAAEAMQAMFDRSLLTRPGVAEAQLAMQESTLSLRAAEEQRDAAERELSRAADVIAERQKAANSFIELQRNANARAADLRQAMSRSQANLLATSRQLTARVAATMESRRLLGSASELLKLALAKLSKAPTRDRDKRRS